jgi:hypothetical protein
MSDKISITVDEEDDDCVILEYPGTPVAYAPFDEIVVDVVDYRTLRGLRDAIIEFLGADQ